MQLLFMVLLWISVCLSPSDFKENQLRHARVKTAYHEKEGVVKGYFTNKNLAYSGFHLYLRAFKKTEELEVWIKEKGKTEFVLLRTYPYCTSSGTLGPKRKEGDGQIPEGIYYINNFNPVSNFHLSLSINYPNQSDKILSDPARPGGSIYIHGNCVTIGCIPITDDKIKELYILAVEAHNNGQLKIPVHIFPDRISNEASIKKLVNEYNPSAATIKFWENLQPMFNDFEKTKTVKPVHVDSHGKYFLNH